MPPVTSTPVNANAGYNAGVTPAPAPTPVTPAVNNNGQTPAPVTPYVTPSTPAIGSSSIAPSTPISVVQPTVTPPPPISSIANSSVVTPPLQATPEQTQQSSLSQQLESLTSTDAGKAQYTIDQGNAAGIPALQQAQTDLGTQLTALQDAAKAIPLQDANEGTGRMSVGGISGQDTINLRTNTIQALNISAQIDATNGLLSAAQTKVTNAVNAQYAPIEAQMAALSANLTNIANDPQSTIDEKNQAQAQLDSVNAQAAQIATAKTTQANIWSLATTAAANIDNFVPSQQYPTAATAITAIQNAPDQATALSIATGTGLTDKATTAQPTATIQEFEYAQKNGYKGSFTEYQQNIANLKNIVPKSPSVADVKTTALDTLQNIVDTNNKGKPIPGTNGVPVIDSNGFITPQALSLALSAAPSEGLTQADVINQLQKNIAKNPDGTVMATYGLNVALAKLVNPAP